MLYMPEALAPGVKHKTVSVSVVTGLMYVADIGLLLVAGLLAIEVDRLMGRFGHRTGYMLVAAISAYATAFTLNQFRDYAAARWRAIGDRAGVILGGLGVGAATFYVGTMMVDYGSASIEVRSHATLVLSWLVAAALVLIAGRIVMLRAVGRWLRDGRLNSRLALLGTDEGAAAFISLLGPGSDFSPRVFGFYRDDSESGTDGPPMMASSQGGLSHLPCLGLKRQLIADGLEGKFDAVVVALPEEDPARIDRMTAQLGHFVTDVYACPWLATASRPLVDFHGVPLAVIAIRPLSDWQLVQKRALDLFIGGILLAALAPSLLLIGLIVKLDSQGPVLFRQTRIGFNNMPFVCFKFRTMFHHSTDLLADRQTTRNDTRVTRFGRWLRRSSLDEMPQLWNVLRGDMSLIGPRPHAPNTRADGRLFVDVVSNYAMRHRVKPGITGWAQVNGWRGETATVEQIEQRVRHDLYYIQNWSLALEFRILLLTSFRGFFASQAF